MSDHRDSVVLVCELLNPKRCIGWRQVFLTVCSAFLRRNSLAIELILEHILGTDAHTSRQYESSAHRLWSLVGPLPLVVCYAAIYRCSIWWCSLFPCIILLDHFRNVAEPEDAEAERQVYDSDSGEVKRPVMSHYFLLEVVSRQRLCLVELCTERSHQRGYSEEVALAEGQVVK
jgi:hypothetical protein